VIRSKAEM